MPVRVRPSDIPPGALERQVGTGAFVALLSVSLVVHQGNARSGAIVLACSVNGCRIKTAQRFGQGLRRMGFWDAPARVAQLAFGRSPHELFGQVVRLHEEEPLPLIRSLKVCHSC